jgi:hypothetical protein
MLKLNASYSKKVPAESEYSSQSYHCTIEVELPDGLTGQQLQDKVHEVFDFVRSSVEAELHGNASVQQTQPAPQTYSASQQNYQQNQGGRQYRNTAASASPRQVNYLLSLAKRAGWTIQQILQRCNVQSVEAIPSKVCSQLIQEFSGVAA